MRPPEFTGGNDIGYNTLSSRYCAKASMRPPEFTGGNTQSLYKPEEFFKKLQ